MALYISFSGIFDDGVHCQNKKWTQTAHIPFDRVKLDSTPSIVVEAQADGDELQALYERFEGLPFPKHITGHSVVTWFGDHAKFIAANLT